MMERYHRSQMQRKDKLNHEQTVEAAKRRAEEKDRIRRWKEHIAKPILLNNP